MADNTQKMFNYFRREEKFTDVAVEIDGRKIQAHRLILSVGSKYFCELFEKEPAAVPLIGKFQFRTILSLDDSASYFFFYSSLLQHSFCSGSERFHVPGGVKCDQFPIHRSHFAGSEERFEIPPSRCIVWSSWNGKSVPFKGYAQGKRSVLLHALLFRSNQENRIKQRRKLLMWRKRSNCLLIYISFNFCNKTQIFLTVRL